MIHIKLFTDVEQSRRLAEILPLKSHDAYYIRDDFQRFSIVYGHSIVIDDELFSYRHGYRLPAWSFSKLFSMLPQIGARCPMIQKLYYASEPKERYICSYGIDFITGEKISPVDAVVDMIIELKQKNLLNDKGTTA